MFEILWYAAAVAAVPAAQSVAAPNPQESGPAIEDVWQASANSSLAATLSGWADRAGWKLVWESDTDFKLAAGATVSGDFETAAQKLLGSFRNTHPRLKAVIYRGNRVLRVWAERVEQ